MNIAVSFEDLSPSRRIAKDGYSIPMLDIKIDPHSDRQLETVFHEIIETWFPWMPHDKIDNLVDELLDGRDQLEVLNGEK